ncbi:hypothetical protein FRC00_004860 [Tulasnella sp. 408]|nr:hypothetical protein FRC00_004860 [Tulasnella sp. 408]
MANLSEARFGNALNHTRSLPKFATPTRHLAELSLLQLGYLDWVLDRSEEHSSPLEAQARLSSSSTIPYKNPFPFNLTCINDLPTETLAQILLFCVTKIDETIRDDSRFGMVRLRRLRSVCARWNYTIIGDPKFWTHIDIRVESPLAVRLKLQRSGALPLTIRYFNPEEITDSGGGNPEFSTIMGLIGGESQRWRSISFWAMDDELDRVTNYLQKSQLPQMEYLKVRRTATSPDILTWTSASAPKLRTVVWDGQVLPWNCSEFRSLVHIEIEGAIGYLDLLVDVIQASQSLETLSLTDTIFNDNDVWEQEEVGWPDESHPPVLPLLRDICISGFESPEAIGCILRCIRAPNVTRLRIFETHSGVGQAGRQISRAISNYHGDESILASMLRKTSPLAKLKLRCSGEVMGLELDDSDRDLLCRLELSLLHPDWTRSAAMIAAAVQGVNLSVRLKFGNQPGTVIEPFLLHFSMAKELEFTSPEMPVEDVLHYLDMLSQSINLSDDADTWICPLLAELRLPAKEQETEIKEIVEAGLVVKRARRDFNNRSTREGDGGGPSEVFAGIRVIVGGLEYGYE